MSKSNKEKLRGFYADLVSYIIVNGLLFLIWALFSGGPYWPIWVLVIWGAVLLVQAAHVGFVPQSGLTIPFLRLFPFLKSVFPFLEDDWQEASLSETSRVVASRFEEVGLETAKSASRAASKTIDKAQHMGEDAVKSAKKSAVKGRSTASKTVRKTADAAKKTTSAATKAGTKTVKKTAGAAKKAGTKAAKGTVKKAAGAAKKTASSAKKTVKKATK